MKHWRTKLIGSSLLLERYQPMLIPMVWECINFHILKLHPSCTSHNMVQTILGLCKCSIFIPFHLMDPVPTSLSLIYPLHMICRKCCQVILSANFRGWTLATGFLMFWCLMVPPFLLIKPTTLFDANFTNMSPPCLLGCS